MLATFAIRWSPRALEIVCAFTLLSICCGCSNHSEREEIPRAGELLAENRVGEALVLLDKVIERNPDSEEAYRLRAKAYRRQGHFQKEVADTSEAIRLSPDDEQAFISRGYANLSAKEYRNVINDADKAILLNPKNAEAHMLRGAAHFWIGDYDKAIADATRTIEMSPNHVKGYQIREAAYRAKGNASGADNDLATARALQRSR